MFLDKDDIIKVFLLYWSIQIPVVDDGLIVFKDSPIHKCQASTDHHCLHQHHIVWFSHYRPMLSFLLPEAFESHLQDEYYDDDVREKEGEPKES